MSSRRSHSLPASKCAAAHSGAAAISLVGQCCGVVEVVDLHAGAGHCQQPRRRAGLVEGSRRRPRAVRPGRDPETPRPVRSQGGGATATGAGGAPSSSVDDRRPAATARAASAASGAWIRERAAIGGGDEHDVGPRAPARQPDLQHVERLGRDQPRAVGLRVLEGGCRSGTQTTASGGHSSGETSGWMNGHSPAGAGSTSGRSTASAIRRSAARSGGPGAGGVGDGHDRLGVEGPAATARRAGREHR